MTMLVIALMGAATWQHPGGMVTNETISEVRAKLETSPWARQVYDGQKKCIEPWTSASSEELKRVFPKKCGNVYHNFSCPADRRRLEFDPFQPDVFRCPSCGKTYPPDTDSGVYTPSERYQGTMYDGWACLFYETAAGVAAQMGLVGRMEPDGAKFVARGIEILMLYADTLEGLPTQVDADPQMSRILTYHREGDSTVLDDLACAYELLRDRMTAEQRSRFERVALGRMLNDIMLEPIYRYNHNNLYQWHRTIVQTAIALERDDLIDWSLGFGAFDPERQPEHRSIRRLAATHFKPDGAYWEMCSGYHLYPLDAFCELAVLTHNLSRTDPVRFPANPYDLTDPASPGGKVIKAALEWFMSMAMPDGSMPTIGDSMASRAGMDDYSTTAEVGYRFLDVKAVGDYERLRQGKRSWGALLYGAREIVRQPTPFTSSYLSSGWVSLRNEWQGNRVWVGLNALIPGGGHQHADRLSLLTYSHGQLLALEKATPYNESVTRVLGTLSPSHNTVTVDKTSQKQGATLTPEETPQVAYFFAGPVVQFAELRADRLYPGVDVYRRSEALIEDVVVDLFRVQGGTTHDWIVNHAGPAPRFSMPTEQGAFTPAGAGPPTEWLANGTGKVLHARTNGIWDAQWSVGGVTSRLTMLGAEGTEVYALETYPVDNAVVTAQYPPCQTLCVRRATSAPFVAVWDAWTVSPTLQAVTAAGPGQAVTLKTAANRYYLAFGPGEARFDDGTSLETDAVFTVVRNRDAVTFVGGSHVEFGAPEGALRITMDKTATLSAEWAAGVVTIECAPDIQYDRYGGVDHRRAAPPVTPAFEGNLWRIDKKQVRSASTSAVSQ